MIDKNIRQISAILKRMSELAEIGQQGRWAKLFVTLNKRLADDTVQVKYEIRRMYGGMGSLNDVVLVGNEGLLKAENDEFFNLTSDLFDLCH